MIVEQVGQLRQIRQHLNEIQSTQNRTWRSILTLSEIKTVLQNIRLLANEMDTRSNLLTRVLTKTLKRLSKNVKLDYSQRMNKWLLNLKCICQKHSSSNR